MVKSKNITFVRRRQFGGEPADTDRKHCPQCGDFSGDPNCRWAGVKAAFSSSKPLKNMLCRAAGYGVLQKATELPLYTRTWSPMPPPVPRTPPTPPECKSPATQRVRSTPRKAKDTPGSRVEGCRAHRGAVGHIEGDVDLDARLDVLVLEQRHRGARDDLGPTVHSAPPPISDSATGWRR